MDNVLFEGKTISEITHNGRCKIYPDGSRQYTVASAAVFREPGYEARKNAVHFSEPDAADDTSSAAAYAARSQRRAKAKLRDYALANTDLCYFVTLTIAPGIMDRYDIDTIMHDVNRWLDNRVRRKGLKYILVPEHHKDGAIHFHGLFNDALPLVHSGLIYTVRPVHNLPAWSFGFSTVIKLYGERQKAVSYVCKYIGKQPEKIGGRWYYSGGQLKKPEVVYFDADFDDEEEQHPGCDFTASDICCRFISYMEGGEADARPRKRT